MNWNEFRANYYQTHGATSRQKLSQEYTNYKNKLSKQNKVIQKRSPVKSPRRVRSPTKSKLTLKDIENMAKNKRFVIFVLYSNNCGHCRDMEKRLGKKMKNTEKIMFLSDDKLSDELKDFYPHVYYYQNGQRQKDLTVDDVYTYLDA